MTKTYNDMEVVTQLLAEVGGRSPHLSLYLSSSKICLLTLSSDWTAGQRLGAGGSYRPVAAAEEPPAAGAQRGRGGAAGAGPGPGTSSWIYHLKNFRVSPPAELFLPDQVNQLQHELGKKDELLRMVASASEESETDSSVSTPLRQPPPPGGTAAAMALSQLEALQSKLQELEEENLSLRSEVETLFTTPSVSRKIEVEIQFECRKKFIQSF